MDWIRITYLTLLLLFGSGLLHAQPLNEAYFFTDSNSIINYGVEAIGEDFFIGGHTMNPNSTPAIFPVLQRLDNNETIEYLNDDNNTDTLNHYGMVNGSLNKTYDNELIISGGYATGNVIFNGGFMSLYDSTGFHKKFKEFPNGPSYAGTNVRRVYKIDSTNYVLIGPERNYDNDFELKLIFYNIELDTYSVQHIYVDSFLSALAVSGSYINGKISVATNLNAAGGGIGTLCIIDYEISTANVNISKFSTLFFNYVEDSYLDNDGNMYICGWVINEYQGVTYWEGVIVKVDSNRNLKWQKRMGGVHGGSCFNAIYPYDNNSFILAGYTTDSLDEISYGFYYGGWLVKGTDLGDSLKIDWEYKPTYLPKETEYVINRFHDVAVNDKKEICAVGYTEPTTSQYQQAWVVKTDSNGCLIDSCWLQTSMVEPQAAAEEAFVLLYPNPAQNNVSIQYYFPTNTATITWSMYDVKGVMVLNGMLSGNQSMQNIDVQQLESGTYFLKVIGTEVLEKRSFVKQ